MGLLDVTVLIAIALTVATGTLVGGRLMRLALRSRKLPEAALGVALFAYGAVCQPVALVSALLWASIASSKSPWAWRVSPI